MALKMTDSNHTTYDDANIKIYFFNHNYLHLFSDLLYNFKWTGREEGRVGYV